MPPLHRAARSASLLFGVSLTLLACGSSSSAPTTPSCTWTVTSDTRSFTAEGGQGVASVSAGSSCGWTATSTSPWLTVTGGSSGTGPGQVQFAVAPNTDSTTRSGGLSVAGQAVTVTQAGKAPCDYQVAPLLVNVTAAESTGTITVTAGSGCAWLHNSQTSWITIITAGQGAIGNGQISYKVSENTSTTGREGTFSVAGRTVTVRQEGRVQTTCDYSVSPVEFSLDYRGHNMAWAPIVLTAGYGCTWVAAPDADWVHVYDTSGNGSNSIRFSVDLNTSEETRRTPIRIRWPTVTAGQNVWITQTGCHFTLGSWSVEIPAAGASSRVDVWNSEDICPSGCGCPWTATSPVDWVRITTALPRYGDDTIFFTVSANTGPARSTTVTVAGKTFTVNQKGS